MQGLHPNSFATSKSLLRNTSLDSFLTFYHMFESCLILRRRKQHRNSYQSNVSNCIYRMKYIFLDAKLQGSNSLQQMLALCHTAKGKKSSQNQVVEKSVMYQLLAADILRALMLFSVCKRVDIWCDG